MTNQTNAQSVTLGKLMEIDLDVVCQHDTKQRVEVLVFKIRDNVPAAVGV